MSTNPGPQIKSNGILWQKWSEFGIAPGTDFEVEFFFYAQEESAADALIAGFEKAGMTAIKSTRRPSLFRKIWSVKIPITQAWTLEALNDKTRQFCQLADMLRLEFDGCGAYMPAQE